ncbi:hypothetical protein ACI2UC_18605 [Ralstonia nicotianae]
MDIRIVSVAPYKVCDYGIELEIEIDGARKMHVLSCSAAFRVLECPAQSPTVLSRYFDLCKRRMEREMRSWNLKEEAQIRATIEVNFR